MAVTPFPAPFECSEHRRVPPTRECVRVPPTRKYSEYPVGALGLPRGSTRITPWEHSDYPVGALGLPPTRECLQATRGSPHSEYLRQAWQLDAITQRRVYRRLRRLPSQRHPSTPWEYSEYPWEYSEYPVGALRVPHRSFLPSGIQ